MVTNPLVLNFQSLELTPGVDDGFRFTTNVSLEGTPDVKGRVAVDKTGSSLNSSMHFAVDESSPSWLSVVVDQSGQVPGTITQVRVIFDAAVADQEWLDTVLAQNTGGNLTHVGGRLDARAEFGGKEMQEIKRVSLVAEGLQAELENGSLNINAALVAGREDERVMVTLPEPAQIRFHDSSGQIHELLKGIVPALQRTSPQKAVAVAVIDGQSNVVIHMGKTNSMTFSGGARLDTTSDENNISLQATDLEIQFEDFSRLDATTANGLVTLNWVENTPFSYFTDELGLKAEKLSLTSTSHVQLTEQAVVINSVGDFGIEFEGMRAKLQTGTAAEPSWLELNSTHYEMQGRLAIDLSMSESDAPVNFEFDGPVKATYPVITVPGDERSPPMTITADEMAISAALTSNNGELVSSGSGIFINGHILPGAASATRTDITWQELDLINLAGNLSTKTQGFTTELEGETWTGFDVDITYSLLNATDINGSGTVRFDSGLDLPIEFAGNTQTEHWYVTLPASRVELSQLGSLLRVAHVEVPESISLTDGYIDMQGDVEIGDEINWRVLHSIQLMAAQSLQRVRWQLNQSHWLAALICQIYTLI